MRSNEDSTPPHDLRVSKSVGREDRAPDPWVVQTALKVGVVGPVLSDGNPLLITWWLMTVNKAVLPPLSLIAFSRYSPPWTTVVLKPLRRSLAPKPTKVMVKEERTRQAETLQLEESSFEESRTDVRPSGKSPSTSVIVSFPFLQTLVSPISTQGNRPLFTFSPWNVFSSVLSPPRSLTSEAMSGT